MLYLNLLLRVCSRNLKNKEHCFKSSVLYFFKSNAFGNYDWNFVVWSRHKFSISTPKNKLLICYRNEFIGITLCRINFAVFCDNISNSSWPKWFARWVYWYSALGLYTHYCLVGFEVPYCLPFKLKFITCLHGARRSGLPLNC